MGSWQELPKRRWVLVSDSEKMAYIEDWIGSWLVGVTGRKITVGFLGSW